MNKIPSHWKSSHQRHYVKELHAIDTALINMDDDDTPLSEAVRQVFWSLLGALAWLLQTRADIAPFVGFLQRNTHDPRIRHLRQINRVLAYCKRVSTGIRFKKLQPPLRLVCVAYAAYQANQDLTECIALKGFLILLVGSDATDSKFPGGHCVCFDYISRKFATITRSSFAAELRNALEAIQAAVYYNTFIKENQSPHIDAQRLVHLQETGLFIHRIDRSWR